jgi:drug/metabolite transporter (DMT)-like permease
MNPTSRTETYRNKPLAGALFVLSASFTFAVLGALIKVVSTSLTNEMVVFFRNLCALIFILPWIWYKRPLGGVKTAFFQLHLLRSLAGLGAMYCFFYAIAHLQLSEACLLASTAPLFIPVIAYIWIHEPVAQKVRGAIIIGFIGIVLILKPGLGVFQPVAIVGLTAGIFVALAMVSIRRMSSSEPTIRNGGCSSLSACWPQLDNSCSPKDTASHRRHRLVHSHTGTLYLLPFSVGYSGVNLSTL